MQSDRRTYDEATSYISACAYINIHTHGTHAHMQLQTLTFAVSFSVFKLDYKNYLAFINHCSHVRGNSSCYGVLPTEEPVYNWRTVIVSTWSSRWSPSNRRIPHSHLPSVWCVLAETQLRAAVIVNTHRRLWCEFDSRHGWCSVVLSRRKLPSVDALHPASEGLNDF